MKNYRFSAFCKYVVSTMVGVLCFVGVSVGQNYALSEVSNITVGDALEESLKL